MTKALVCCRAGMGSSMLLKIRVDQVIKENNLPIETCHGNLNAAPTFHADVIITMEDLEPEVKEFAPATIGIRSIVDKNELLTKLQDYLKSKGEE